MFLFRPPILFQRQGSTIRNVQVEIPIISLSTSNNSINGNLSATSECSEHQSPTSSQTITTIASISRSNDNEFTVVDATSLITEHGKVEFVGGDGKQQDLNRSNNDLNCSRSSIRYPLENSSDRIDFVRLTELCKNVNKSLTPIAQLPPLSRDTLVQNGKVARCVMGVR